MEWIEGVKLTDKAAMEAAGLDVVDFVDVGIECTLRQLLEHGYFHAGGQYGRPGWTCLVTVPAAVAVAVAVTGDCGCTLCR